MRIAGFEPLTLIDYPGHLATIAFTPGCLLQCPYCHNPELIKTDTNCPSAFFTINREKEFFDFLSKRRGKLDGVVITGGEPTLHADLIDCIQRIKDMGFLVKLDTNGIFPDKVATILQSGLVDYWAMDIKHTPEKYALASGRNIPIERFQQSVKLLMNSGVPYEFRTTVVPGIHEVRDFPIIGEWIRGARHYSLQAFRSIKIADETLLERAKDKSLNLWAIRDSLFPYLTSVSVRE